MTRLSDVLGNTTAWFWNDPVVCPWGTEYSRRYGYQLGDIVALHRALDNLHESHLFAVATDEAVMAKYAAAAETRQKHRDGQAVDQAGLVRAESLLAAFPRSVADISSKLADAHLDLGDEDGFMFWKWWSDFQGYPYYDNGYWWFDNQMILPSESYFRIPFAVIELMYRGALKQPAAGGCLVPDEFRTPEKKEMAYRRDEEAQRALVRAAEEAERAFESDRNNRQAEVAAFWARWQAMQYQPLRWDTTRPNEGDKIVRHGFHGRLCAETTILSGWRLMTANERAAAVSGDFEYIDPSRFAG
jgi:hypothetical protein